MNPRLWTNFADLLKTLKQGFYVARQREDPLARGKAHRREKARYHLAFFSIELRGAVLLTDPVIPKEAVSGCSHKDRT